nr:hypothetical protein [Pseudomonas chengduensis]
MMADPKALRLIRVVQELSMAKDVDRVAEIVRSAARELTGADGATFVLRDGQQCFYRDEDAAPVEGPAFPPEHVHQWVGYAQSSRHGDCRYLRRLAHSP